MEATIQPLRLARVGRILLGRGTLVCTLLLLEACTSQAPPPRLQVADGLATPVAAQATLVIPSPIISTPAPGPPTPPRPTETPHPLTPVPTPPPLVTPASTPTARGLTPAPSHTPGPTPTNPPGEEAALRQAFAAALQERQARGGEWKPDPMTRIAVSYVHIQGEWAILDLYRQYLNGSPVPAGGGIALARKIGGQWQIAFRGESDYNAWLEALPDSLMTPQDRAHFR